MRMLIAITLCVSLLSGCSFFGYYRHIKPERAAPEEIAQLQFPDSFENGVHLKGPLLSAVGVAMRDFFPPDAEARGSDNNEAMAKCLARSATYDISVLQAEENLFFVRFTPFVSRCNLDEYILDGGAVYAIDGSGRILDVR